MDQRAASATLRSVAESVVRLGQRPVETDVVRHLEDVAKLIDVGAYEDAYANLVGYHQTVRLAMVDYGESPDAERVKAVERWVYEAADEALPANLHETIEALRQVVRQ